MTVGRVEGYAIVSEDGMLADAACVMPDSLIFEADQRFYEQGLDNVDVVVHGRHSREQHARSPLRNRLILTHRIPAIEAHATNKKAFWWNPLGASFDDALGMFQVECPAIGVIGGPDVFQLFLPRYDVFYLSRAPNVVLPGGRPVFPEVPARTPEDVLRTHGLIPGPTEHLDPARGLTMVGWKRAAAGQSRVTSG